MSIICLSARKKKIKKSTSQRKRKKKKKPSFQWFLWIVIYGKLLQQHEFFYLSKGQAEAVISALLKSMKKAWGLALFFHTETQRKALIDKETLTLETFNHRCLYVLCGNSITPIDIKAFCPLLWYKTCERVKIWSGLIYEKMHLSVLDKSSSLGIAFVLSFRVKIISGAEC